MRASNRRDNSLGIELNPLGPPGLAKASPAEGQTQAGTDQNATEPKAPPRPPVETLPGGQRLVPIIFTTQPSSAPAAQSPEESEHQGNFAPYRPDGQRPSSVTDHHAAESPIPVFNLDAEATPPRDIPVSHSPSLQDPQGAGSVEALRVSTMPTMGNYLGTPGRNHQGHLNYSVVCVVIVLCPTGAFVLLARPGYHRLSRPCRVVLSNLSQGILRRLRVQRVLASNPVVARMPPGIALRQMLLGLQV